MLNHDTLVQLKSEPLAVKFKTQICKQSLTIPCCVKAEEKA